MTLLTFLGITALVGSASAEPIMSHQPQEEALAPASSDWVPADSPAEFARLSHSSTLTAPPSDTSSKDFTRSSKETIASAVSTWVWGSRQNHSADVQIVAANALDESSAQRKPMANLPEDLLSQCTGLQAEPKALLAAHSVPQFAHHQVWVNEQLVGLVDTPDQAYGMAQQLKQLTQRSKLDPSQIEPDLSQSQPVVKLNQEGLFVVDTTMAKTLGTSPEWAALQWANNLRVALGAAPLDMGTVQMALQGLEETTNRLEGTASWYGPYFHGRLTATGEVFDQTELTVAHKTLPFGTLLKVRNLLNDQTIVVRVNDRGPYVGDRSLDLSRAAAQCLGSDQVGLIPYEAVLLEKAQPSSRTVALGHAP